MKYLSLLFLLFALGCTPDSSETPKAANPTPLDDDTPTLSECDLVLPFKTSSSRLMALDLSACEYTPVVIRGVNLGIATPGKYAGDLSTTAGYADFKRWFQLMAEAGINTLRLYTLHMPAFYDALYDFNQQREADGLFPLLVIHGVWIEGEGQLDLYTVDMAEDIQNAVNVIHGNATILERPARAFGGYQSDISKWLLAWVIGREISPPEIELTNANHLLIPGYEGDFISLRSGRAAEAWVTARLDDLVSYEVAQYGESRPVSFINWPTLDPMNHYTEHLPLGGGYEDSQELDLSAVDDSQFAPGVFHSFHVDSTFPNFISEDPVYRSYSDALGGNSYLGYLVDLKHYYRGKPLLIAEFGVSSSWGSAHAAHNGIHHGGHNETQQGEHFLRIMNNIESLGLAGGMMFSWIDEWWKPTWLTNEFDFPFERRAYWHNIMAPEQNYGLIKFVPVAPEMVPYGWSGSVPGPDVKVGFDAAFYHLHLLTSGLSIHDEVVVAFDTYDSQLGESQIGPSISSLMTPAIVTTQRSEFLLRIYHDDTSWQSQMYVTEAYDLYGTFGNLHDPSVQQLQSVPSDGGAWNPIKWKTDYRDYTDIYGSFYGLLENREFNAGKLQVSGAVPNSKDAIFISGTEVKIKIPWSLLQFIDPSQMLVFHDDPATPEMIHESIKSDGIAIAVLLNGQLVGESDRYVWSRWDLPEYSVIPKQSYEVIKQAFN